MNRCRNMWRKNWILKPDALDIFMTSHNLCRKQKKFIFQGHGIVERSVYWSRESYHKPKTWPSCLFLVLAVQTPSLRWAAGGDEPQQGFVKEMWSIKYCESYFFPLILLGLKKKIKGKMLALAIDIDFHLSRVELYSKSK